MGMKSKSTHFGNNSGGPSTRKGGFGLNLQLFAKMPKQRAQRMHIMAKREGHMTDSRKNRKVLEKVSNNSSNYIKTDPRGFKIYSKVIKKHEYWVYTRNGIIQDGGRNSPGKFRFHTEIKEKGGK